MNREFILNTDASASAIAAILTQKYDGIEHPVCYVSRTLNTAEQRYSTIEKECLAIVYAVKKYRIYLTGTHFTIMTDHRPLKYLLNIKDPSSRLAKWSMFLMEYSFTVQYRPGKMNANVDSLTRLRTDDPPPISAVLHENELTPIYDVHWNKEDLIRLQTEDHELNCLINNSTLDEDTDYIIIDGLLRKRRNSNQRNDPIVAPKCIINDLLKIYHMSLYAAHPGQKKTKEMLEREFYWKNMRKYIQRFVESCPSCQIQKTNPQGPPELQKTPIPTHVWGRISLDLVGPLNRTRQGNRYILTCVDFLTR